jgi:hypothetical protein
VETRQSNPWRLYGSNSRTCRSASFVIIPLRDDREMPKGVFTKSLLGCGRGENRLTATPWFNRKRSLRGPFLASGLWFGGPAGLGT